MKPGQLRRQACTRERRSQMAGSPTRTGKTVIPNSAFDFIGVYRRSSAVPFALQGK
jgi:hypothetical protein